MPYSQQEKDRLRRESKERTASLFRPNKESEASSPPEATPKPELKERPNTTHSYRNQTFASLNRVSSRSPAAFSRTNTLNSKRDESRSGSATKISNVKKQQSRESSRPIWNSSTVASRIPTPTVFPKTPLKRRSGSVDRSARSSMSASNTSQTPLKRRSGSVDRSASASTSTSNTSQTLLKRRSGFVDRSASASTSASNISQTPLKKRRSGFVDRSAGASTSASNTSQNRFKSRTGSVDNPTSQTSKEFFDVPNNKNKGYVDNPTPQTSKEFFHTPNNENKDGWNWQHVARTDQTRFKSRTGYVDYPTSQTSKEFFDAPNNKNKGYVDNPTPQTSKEFFDTPNNENKDGWNWQHVAITTAKTVIAVSIVAVAVTVVFKAVMNKTRN